MKRSTLPYPSAFQRANAFLVEPFLQSVGVLAALRNAIVPR